MYRHWFFVVVSLSVTVTLGAQSSFDNCPGIGTAKPDQVRQLNLLKNRDNPPDPEQIDAAVSLDALVQPGDDTNRWSSARGATIRGYVVDVLKGGIETCNCRKTDPLHRDTHIALVADPNDDGPERRVIVEVTPRWREHMRQQGIDWSTDTLETTLLHQWVTVTGWLLFDSEHKGQAENTAPANDTDWRATAWEIHPITALEVGVAPITAASKATIATIGTVRRTRSVDGQVHAVHADVNSLSLLVDHSLEEFAISQADPPAGWQHLRAGDLVHAEIAPGRSPSKITKIDLKLAHPTWLGRLGAFIAAIAIVWILAAVVLRAVGAASLVEGKDGRYSTSKFQMTLWFGVVLVTYVATVLVRAVMSGGSLIGSVDLPQNLLLLSGLSALSFAGAKAITVNHIAKGAAPTKAAVVSARASFPGDLINDDSGTVDFARFQIVIITLLAVVVYLASVISFLGNVPLSGSVTVPDVDVTILGAFGLGQGAYLANKVYSPSS